MQDDAGRKRKKNKEASLRVKSSNLDPDNKKNNNNSCLKGED